MAPGLVVMGGDSSSEDCGFEYLRRILDEHYKNKNEAGFSQSKNEHLI